MERYKVTIITACYNAVREIENTIVSVISQTYSNLEYIIIDGDSKDGTLDIINKYSSKIPVVVSEPDKGIYDAMNKGIELATGDLILFMNAGDRFSDINVIEESSKFFSKETDYYYGDCICEHTYGNTYAQAANLSHLKKEMPFSHQSVFVSRTVMQAYRFDTSYRLAADYKLMLQGYVDKKSFKYIPLPIAIVEKDNGATASHFLDSKKEVYSIQKELGIPFVSRVIVFTSLVLKGFLAATLRKIVPSSFIRRIRKPQSYDN